MTENPDLDRIIHDGLELPPEKKIYFNGFVVSVTAPDVFIVLQQNNKPVAFLNTSHIIAKTLISQLQVLLEKFEKDTEIPIQTLDDIQKKIQSKENANSK